MRILLFLLAAMAAPAAIAQNAAALPAVAARAWQLVDFASSQPLAGQNADERVEPASLTKLMTAYLSFAALRDGRLKRDQVVPVSTRAWKAPGSRMFIQPDKPVTVDELLRGMIVQSGNDACIALAEAIAGSEEKFAAMMNAEARRLGLAASHFVNATGLPDPQHYSTARDLASLARALIRDFPGDYPLYSQKEYTYNRITQQNRNRLLWLDPAVDGVKTGFTEAAGYCLIASARRDTRRLLAVVLGTASDALRAQEAQRLLNFGFQYYDAVRLYGANQPISQLKVFKGSQASVGAGFREDLVLSLPKGAAERLKVDLVSVQPLLAPVQAGQRVATLKLSIDGKPWGEYTLVALQEVPAAGMLGRAWDTLMLWFR